MSHPFSKMFERALKKNSPDENLVFAEAEKLVAKGYRPEEIYTVLVGLQKSLIDDTEAALVQEACEWFAEEHLEPTE